MRLRSLKEVNDRDCFGRNHVQRETYIALARGGFGVDVCRGGRSGGNGEHREDRAQRDHRFENPAALRLYNHGFDLG